MDPKDTFSWTNLHDAQWVVNDLKLACLRGLLATAALIHAVFRANGEGTSPRALTANQPD